MKKKIRTQHEVIEDIKVLVASPGYIVTLCMILFEDNHIFMEELDKLNTQGRISKNESTFLIALFLQNKEIIWEPTQPEDLIIYKKKTYTLFEELHFSYNIPFINKLSALITSKEDNKQELPFREEQKKVLGDAQIVKEAITYAGTGVYDVQYLNFIELKYKYDKDWLIKNKNFEFDDIKNIALEIKAIHAKKSEKIYLVGLKENTDGIIKKAKKKIKGHFNEAYFRDTILPTFDFFQYRELFDPILFEDSNKDEARKLGWQSFYQGIIDLFVVKKSDIHSGKNVDAFFNNFSFDPNVDNTDSVSTMEDYNIISSKPIIKIDDDRYFIPNNFLLFEAVYESPFYWMCLDKSYKDQLSANRGNTGEEIAFNLLFKVFGDHTYRGIKVYTKKGEPDTDIDVLCILGNKALCIQVKSKKLTQLARTGNNDQLLKDFSGAVQDAYDQGLICREKIIDKSAHFFDANGKEIEFAEQIDEVYIMGITTENYPSLTHQSYVLLDKKDIDPFPIFLNIFDLQLLVHYLKDPYDFLYYIRQRIKLMDYCRADEELVYLGYHLTHKLDKVPNADYLGLNNDYGLLIDRNYYPYIYGLNDNNTKNDKIRFSWINSDFQEICKTLKEFNAPQITDVIFDIFDMNEETRNKMIEAIKSRKQATQIDHKNHNFSLLPGAIDSAGLTFVSHSTNSPTLLRKDLDGLVAARKYKQKANKWIGLGSFYTSEPNQVDLVAYHSYEWFYDSKMEKASNDALGAPYKGLTTYSGHKIGRNDPCPCGSGKKYKKCCGQN